MVCILAIATVPRPALVVANDSFDVAAGARTVKPLANDAGYDAGTLTIKSYPQTLLIWVNPDHSIGMIVPAGLHGESRTFNYQVCDAPGGRCKSGTVHLNLKG